ncbi:MAG: sulfotransferase family protein [Sphingomonadales bacterium]|nr:sulfotransferase family protein [Sphingomonadales bacterium]NCQ20418.1 sulfotransferase family protein [Sphingomonadales bacterium]NCT03026.1 sulfotransferase family protein [Sphingomonadales bacterium]
MYLDHPKKLVFVHNPKTAGRSIVRLLRLDDADSFRFAHVYASTIRSKFLQDDWDQFFSFCVVRNPWERYVSLYKFQRSPMYAAMLRNNLSSLIAGRFGLNDWIEYNAMSEAKANWFGIDQKRWWEGVTTVFRFEDIEAAMQELAARFGSTVAVPHENASKASGRAFTEQLNDRSKAIIAELDRATIEEFGYVAN